MDRRELLDRAAHSPEERLLLSRVWDKCEQCRTRNIPTATGFLSPQEQAAAQHLLNALGCREGYVLWGGYDGAERKRLLFLPEWMAEPDGTEIAAVRAACRSGGDLMNCTPFVRQYDILSNKWGVLLCQKEYQTNDIRRSSREWL
ncbi:MAG: hypothetical protein ACLUEM_00580 [Oscillospiraceae bacterium]